MIKFNSAQRAYFIAFISVGLLLAAAAYLQWYVGIMPCPLCLIQRFCFLSLGLLFLVGTWVGHKKWGKSFVGLLGLLISLFGLIVAGRQIWLQHQPQLPGANCEVGLSYMLEALPFTEVIKKIMSGSGNCSQVEWTFLQMSLAEWSFFAFLFYFNFLIWQIRRYKK